MWKDLNDIVLVGHSFGGIVITGAAEKLRGKIAAIVYVDAFIPLDGQSMKSLRNNPDAPLPVPVVPSPPAAYFGVNAADANWVGSKATPHPTKCFTEPVHVTDAYQQIPNKVYIRAPAFKQPAFDSAYARCRADSTWKTHELPCGHDIMIDLPAELSAIIESVTS
jgi:pimeloyl-ACP methyl ester carboxylesterase